MQGVLAQTRRVLLQLNPLRRFFLVLGRPVVDVFGFRALEFDNFAGHLLYLFRPKFRRFAALRLVELQFLQHASAPVLQPGRLAYGAKPHSRVTKRFR